MGESTEGPSGAARRARPDEEGEGNGRQGFFQRLFARDEDEGDTEPAEIVPFRRGRDEGAALAGPAARNAQRLMVNTRKLSTMRVEDVAVPRADIQAVPADATLAEVVAVFRETTLSRLPVYAETLDHPIGMVHLKDVALGHGFDAADRRFDLTALVRPVLYAPPSMPASVLMQKMQAARIHMALVIDEYGGVDGLVTFEDLVEQIIGDISDEHDDDDGTELDWTAEAPGVYLALARAELDAFERAVGVRLADPERDEEIDTLGGLVFRLLGRVPERGEMVAHPDGHVFEVVEADPRRIKRLRLRLYGAGLNGRAAE